MRMMRISGSRRKFNTSIVRTRCLALCALGALTLCHSGSAADKAPPPAQPATTYLDADTHPAEHVSIAAEPFTGSRAAFFHLNYPAYGLMPVRMIITNDGDTPISLSQARIDFITAAGDKIPAAQIEDVERMINTPPNPGTKIPLGPIPITVGGKGKNKDKQIKADFDAYGFGSIAVEPHTTHAGFFFYDVSGIDHPLIGAKLEVREVQTSDGRQMFAFEVPFYKLGVNY
jgi:hypothetical protein